MIDDTLAPMDQLFAEPVYSDTHHTDELYMKALQE